MITEPTTANLFPPSWQWEPSSSYQKITTIDTHTGGEPLRIITSGLPPIYGSTLLQKRRYFMEHYDYIRTGILLEPRGHADMYGAILTTPSDPKADLDVFFINTDGYSTMCGHAVLAITKVVLETGLITKEGAQKQVIMNTPAGLVHASASIVGNEVRDIKFRNVASFVYLQDQKVEVNGIGSVGFDIAFGGIFFAIVEAGSVKCELKTENLGALVDYGRRIKKAISDNFEIEHPFEKDLNSLFGVIFIEKPQVPEYHSRNVNIFEDGKVDRSSTGTGVSARAALLVTKGELKLNETVVVESIVGSTMNVRAVEMVEFGQYEAVLLEVGGEVSITGKHELYFHSEDPYKAGFALGS